MDGERRAEPEQRALIRPRLTTVLRSRPNLKRATASFLRVTHINPRSPSFMSARCCGRAFLIGIALAIIASCFLITVGEIIADFILTRAYAHAARAIIVVDVEAPNIKDAIGFRAHCDIAKTR